MTAVPEWVTLTDGEEVLWQGRPAIFPYLGRFVGPLLVAGLGLVVVTVATGVLPLGLPASVVVPGSVLGVVLVVVGVALVGRVVVEWRSIDYLLTSEEVYRKQGVVSRRVQNLRLDQIQNTSFTQSAVGRLTAHGDIHIETAGRDGTEIVFEDVPHPEQVLSYITEALDRRAS